MIHEQDQVKTSVEHLEAYIKALQAHDWGFEMTDDHSAWSAGKESLTALRTARKMIDPYYMVWNHWAPDEWKVKVVPLGEPA